MQNGLSKNIRSNLDASSTTNRESENLLVFNALGRVDTLPYNLYAKTSHFADWACIAFMHVREDVIADDQQILVKLKEEGCNVIRTPDVHWGVFIQYLSPVLVSHYKHIALLLDDVLLPKIGPLSIDVPRLLHEMEEFDLSVISPAVGGGGANHLQFRPEGNHTEQGCLASTPYVETFFQIFTNDAWNKYHSILHYSGGRGWCYDLCFKVLHPTVRIAVDYSQAAWHLESPVPKQVLEKFDNSEFQDIENLNLPKNGTMYKISKKDRKQLCNLHGCKRPENFKQSILKCSSKSRSRPI